jgi:HK97 family phage prohead protease
MTQNLMMVCEAKLVLESQDAKEQTGKIEATVTTWGPREGADGRRFNYNAEGFMDWAKEFSNSGRPLPMFVNHEADDIPVGEWSSFEFDDTGMKASGRLYMNTTKGSDLYQVMQESPNMFGGVSVGAYADEYSMVKEDGEPTDDDDEEGYFQITKGGLREVSVVMYPNNPQANVNKLEFFRPDGSADLKVLERALRDAGLLKKDAVTSVSILKKALAQRDFVQAPIEKTDAKSDSDADVTNEEILNALTERELLKALNKRLKD